LVFVLLVCLVFPGIPAITLQQATCCQRGARIKQAPEPHKQTLHTGTAVNKAACNTRFFVQTMWNHYNNPLPHPEGCSTIAGGCYVRSTLVKLALATLNQRQLAPRLDHPSEFQLVAYQRRAPASRCRSSADNNS
jgi:hypothetical protein